MRPRVPSAQPSVLWRASLGNVTRSDGLLANGLLYIGDDNGSLYALNTTSGRTRWRYQTGGAVFAGPTLSSDASSIFIGSLNGSEAKLRSSDGHLQWRFPTGSGIGTTSTLSAAGDTLLWHL